MKDETIKAIAVATVARYRDNGGIDISGFNGAYPYRSVLYVDKSIVHISEHLPDKTLYYTAKVKL